MSGVGAGKSEGRSQDRVYKDLIRISEQTLVFQVKILLDRFDRSDRLMRLGVGTLAGMTAVMGFFFSQGVNLRFLGAAGLGASIVVAMASIYMLVRTNTSLHRDVTLDLGPDTRDILRFMDQEDLSGEDYSAFMAVELPNHIEKNEQVIRFLSARQGRAIGVLTSGVILHLGAIVFILGGFIHG